MTEVAIDTKTTAERYDAVAQWWLEQMQGSDYGLQQLERALAFVKNRGVALDVGCGAEGRFLRRLLTAGFRCEGLDASGEMIRLARARQSNVEYIHADISTWDMPQKYDFISAWDSVFHLPLVHQAPVLRKLCCGLREGGVLLFTGGGGFKARQIQGEFGGKTFAYSTLGVPRFIELFMEQNFELLHLEYDQMPENHLTIIAGRLGASATRR